MRRRLWPTSLCEAESRRDPEGSAAEDQLLCGQREVSAASAGRLLPAQKAQCRSLIGAVCGSVVSGIVNKSAFSWLVLFGHVDHADEVSTRNTQRPLTNAAFVLLFFFKDSGQSGKVWRKNFCPDPVSGLKRRPRRSPGRERRTVQLFLSRRRLHNKTMTLRVKATWKKRHRAKRHRPPPGRSSTSP